MSMFVYLTSVSSGLLLGFLSGRAYGARAMKQRQSAAPQPEPSEATMQRFERVMAASSAPWNRIRDGTWCIEAGAVGVAALA